MITQELLTFFAQFGVAGVLGLVMVWDRIDRRAHDKERSEADKALATALTALTITIQHMAERIKS